MNRLILLGNGFDLAHGLETSYKDFIKGYLRKILLKAYEGSSYEDIFVSIEYNSNDWTGIINHIDYFLKNGLKELINNQELFELGSVKRSGFKVQVKSSFFRKLLDNCFDAKWVDIENEFYRELKSILHDSLKNEKKEIKLRELNSSMTVLIQELESYLSTIVPERYETAYYGVLHSIIKREELVSNQSIYDTKPKDTMILNFNYTKTIENYIRKGKKYILAEENTISEINYIHGQIGSVENPVIFGFGDELDQDYLKMELEEVKGFFQYIKSFWYFHTSNYYNLIRFIDSDDFQVFILGHSCGLSDRTMLNMIFEHEHCKSIKIFYHQNKEGKNNYRELTQEISRHFKNKSEMRRKIVSFDKSEAMPQVIS